MHPAGATALLDTIDGPIRGTFYVMTIIQGISVDKQAFLSQNKSKTSGFGELIRTLIYALVIAAGVRTIAFEPFNIPSSSMVPTLLVGDYLFVSKYAYGYSRHSLPLSPPLFDGRIFESEPERGDVAVFKWPDDNSTDYIKRMIGLPGDRIQVVGGVLHINGEPVERRRIEDYVSRDGFGNLRREPQYIETLPNGRSHLIIESGGDTARFDDTRVFVVPAGHYFAMGDNRDNSADSRAFRNSFVPAENLVGRANFIFFSIDGGHGILELWSWPSNARFDRLLDAVK